MTASIFATNPLDRRFAGHSACVSRFFEPDPETGIVPDLSDVVATILEPGGEISISPTYVSATYVWRGTLVLVLPKFATERSDITALWSASRRGSPNVKAILSFLDEVFPSPTPLDHVCFRAGPIEG